MPLYEMRKFVAPEFIFGVGARHRVGFYAQHLQARRILVVTDPGVIRAGWLAELQTNLEACDLLSIVFSEVMPNPKDHAIMAGVQAYRDHGCDVIVALGGGSVIDCAKGIGIVAGNGGHILDFEGVDRISRPGPPLICIPTTAGTAADISQFAIINNTDRRYKIAIISKSVVPDVALVDPETTLTMDPYLTACTGIDALAHAIEAYVSTASSPVMDVHALAAVALIRDNLPLTIADSANLAARENMMLASLQAGLAFSNASLGAVHAMSHSLGGYLDLPHGESNALLLEHVIRFNYRDAAPRYRQIGQALGVNLSRTPAARCETQITGAVHALRTVCGIHDGLARRGITYSEIADLAPPATRDACLFTNPRRASLADIKTLYAEALSEEDDAGAWESQRDLIIGLGERSFRKSYYPELRRNLAQLERFRALLDFAGEMVLLVTLPDGAIIDANTAVAEALGQPVETLIGCRLHQLGLSRAADLIAALNQDAAVDEAPIRRLQEQMDSPSGSLPIDLTYRTATLEGRRYGVLLGRDARPRLAAEARMRLAERVFAESGEGIMILDTQGAILEVNHAFETITGYGQAEAAGQYPKMLLTSDYHPAEFYQQMWATLQEQGHWQGEIWNRRKNGEIYPEWLSVSAIRNQAGVVRNYVAMFSDISQVKASEAQRKADEARIQHMAHHDFLTGLPNRFLLNDRFGQMQAAARRDQTRFALLFIDLDRFKNVNDTLGHTIGDQLLCLIARRLLALVRAVDTVSRQGGDEFIVLLAGIASPQDAGHAAHKLVRALGEPCVVDGHELTVTPSVGIAISPDDGENLDTLLKHADLAMYDAKRQGRNMFQFFRPAMNARMLDLLLLENQLRQALKREEFELFYQPQLDLATGRIVAFEALARWRHPERGLVSPADFIPLTEETGLILPLGRWVLQEACRQAALWRSRAWPEIRIAVNLSAVQFRQADLADQVRRALASAGVEADVLELEVTESVVMQDAETTIQTLQALRAMGVTLAIDDFGTGYSSLAYLKRFPVNTLKVDRSFVQDIEDDPDAAAICAAVIGLAHNLRLAVVAEGVETAEQLAWLHAAGCQSAQGFLLGKPLPAAAYENSG